jgi:hypothetical protein
VVRVRENSTQGDGTGGLINGDVGKLKGTRLREFNAVTGDQLYFRFTVFLFQRAVCQLLFQTQEIVAGLGNVNVDRIKLLHGGQRSGLPVLHQRAFRNGRFTNTTANR